MKITHQPEVTGVITPESYTLTITREQLKFLSAIMWHIGGCPDKSLRRCQIEFSAAIYALDPALYYDSCECVCGGGGIRFEEGVGL